MSEEDANLGRHMQCNRVDRDCDFNFSPFGFYFDQSWAGTNETKAYNIFECC